MTIRIGEIAYANCYPIFQTLRRLRSAVELSFIQGVPAELNAQLATGALDLSPSSSIIYAQSPGRFRILSGLSISAIGAVRSVLLFSRQPIGQLAGAEIALTTESDTSVALLAILLERYYGLHVRYVRSPLPAEEALQRYAAVLLIGDNALHTAAIAQNVQVYDLGEEWYRLTGLPFVFALWIVQRSVVEERPEELLACWQLLRQATSEALASLPELAAGCERYPWLESADLVRYWQENLSYELTSEHLAGLRLFYRHAVELGLLAAEPEIALFPFASDVMSAQELL